MSPATLYGIKHSHPSHSARLMLERKGIEHRIVHVLPGLHPLTVRARGFRGGSVPALRIDGQRLQGTLRISRALEELAPEPSLFGADPDTRRAIEEAERWGHDVVQPVPRRIFRWMLQHDGGVRRWMATDIVGWPAFVAPGMVPIGILYAKISSADEAAVRADLQGLPALLEHCDELVAAGTLGGDDVNAADCQILPSLRLMLGLDDLAGLIEGRPCAAAARRALPDFPGPVPAALPAAWLPG